MIHLNLNDISEGQNIRQQKKSLKYLKQAFQTQKTNHQKETPKQKNDFEQLISKIKTQRLKQVFLKKLTLNNIHQPRRQVQLLSESQFNKKRLIKWKGLKLHQHLLSVIYIVEILFLVITFYISTCIAFLPDFIQTDSHNSLVVIGLNGATVLLSCIKILITSTTQTIKKGIMLIYITDIFIAYAKSLILFIDLIYLSIIVTLFILSNLFAKLGSSQAEITNLGVALFIWSIVRISISNENLTYFRTTFLNSFKKQQYYKLFKVILFNFIFAHFVASMLLAMSELDRNQNWMISMQIYHEVWYVQYMWSYYWATTIMMTVGFGDFLPVTYKEGFIVSLIQFFSCIVLAYNISQIGSIISTIRSSQDEYVAKLGVFKRMAEQNSVDLQLKIKIQDYLREQIAIKQKFEFNQQIQLVNSLPQPLRKQFIMASNGKIFGFLPFFKGLQITTLIKLAEIFKSKVYYPGQIISKANQYNEFINILKDGKVGMTYQKQKSCMNGIIVESVQILNRQCLNSVGQFVRMMCPILLNTEFLSPGKIISYDMNALTYSYVFQLNHVDFMEAIKKNEIDSEYFFSIVHSTPIKLFEWEQLPCQQCQSNEQEDGITQSVLKFGKQYIFQKNHQYHTRFQCPRLHYMPMKSIIIMKYSRIPSKPQESKPKYKRQKIRTQSCLLHRKKAFKVFERKMFINEKKDFQKFVEKAMSVISTKNLLKPKKQYSSFRLENRRKMSEGNVNISQKKIHFDKSIFGLKQEQSNNESRDHSKSDPTNELSSSSIDDQKTIIESVVKFAVNEVYPRHISCAFWNLQIDLMWNYFKYFPHCNAIQFDRMQLVKNKVYKNKAFCLIGKIMKKYINRKSSLKMIHKPRSMYNQDFEQRDKNTFYVRKSSMQINLEQYENQQQNNEKGASRMGAINLFDSGRPLVMQHAIQLNKKGTLKKKQQSLPQENAQRQYPIRIQIPSETIIYENDSIIDRSAILINVDKEKSSLNESSMSLKNLCWF